MTHSDPTAPDPTSLGSGAALALGALALGQSLLVRGPRRSRRVFAAAVGISAVGEVLIIRGMGALRHHTHPQIAGVPLTISLSWYGTVAPAYSLAQAAVADKGVAPVVAVTALLATATDLANDPWGLSSGYWEWRDGGYYMPDLIGTNGKTGIPLGNYVAWLIICAGVAWIAEVDWPPTEMRAVRRWRSLLLLQYWFLGLPGLIWAARERRWWLLMASIGTVGCGGAAAWYAAHPK